jgi:hypothetical protein
MLYGYSHRLEWKWALITPRYRHRMHFLETWMGDLVARSPTESDSLIISVRSFTGSEAG